MRVVRRLALIITLAVVISFFNCAAADDSSVRITSLKWKFLSKTSEWVDVSWIVKIHNGDSKPHSVHVVVTFYDADGFEVASQWRYAKNIPARSEGTLTAKRPIEGGKGNTIKTAKA